MYANYVARGVSPQDERYKIMQNLVMHVTIPSSVKGDVSEKKILHRLMEEALTKKEYYEGQERFFSGKYGMSFSRFQAKISRGSRENFDWWDDSMEWEACRTAAGEWSRKYKDLVHCWKFSKK